MVIKQGKQWLLAVGVNEYGAQVELPNLHCAVNDACLVYNTLTTEYNFEGVLLARKQDVATGKYPQLDGVAAGDGTRVEIIEHINQLRRQMGHDDLFVLFFSGHGIKQAPGYVLPFGSEWEKPSSYLMYRNLYGELSALSCRNQVLFFDCCYSGVATQSTTYSSAIGSHNPAKTAPRVVAFSATGEDQITPDRIPGVGSGGNHSPFSWALVKYLTEEVPIGGVFDPIKYFSYSEACYSEWIPHHILGTKILPQYRNEVPEVRLGRGPLHIRRPGLRIDMPKSYECLAGEELILALKAHCRNSSSMSLRWEITPRQIKFAPTENKKTGYDRWKLRFQYAGIYSFNVRVDASEGGETAFLAINIIVKQAVKRHLSIETAPLAICFKEEKYKGKIVATGGVPPCTYEIKGLPNPLGWSVGDDHRSLLFQGVIPEHPKAGTAAAHDDSPIAYNLDITVRDAVGNSFKTAKRLLVISRKNYCRLSEDKGEFYIGYVHTDDREKSIEEMLKQYALRFVNARDPDSTKTVEKTVAKVASNLWNEVREETLEVNPGSKASISEFYIKKYPVTNAEWYEFVNAHPGTNHIPADWEEDEFPADRATYPVVNITYQAICAYLGWKGTRLPTAWEWERGARGTDGRLFPWGDEFDFNKCNTLLPETAQISGHQDLKHLLTQVNTFDDEYPKDICVRDIVGNAAEWVDRRVYQHGVQKIDGVVHRGYFAQVFRGGSYGDTCSYTLTFRDSEEAGLLFFGTEENLVIGNTKTDFQWVGFRDVVDLHADPIQPQGLMEIPCSNVVIDGEMIEVEAFAISRYAVSNLEYWEFVKSSGHPHPLKWDNNSTPPFPWDQRHLPVVNVQFHDALAFCFWKSRQSGIIIRLPSSEQWQAVLSDCEHRCFPWGEKFDLQKCNSRSSGWGRRLTVFSLPEGQSKHGVFNLVGNVCEWTGPDRVCGGSWQDDCQKLIEDGTVIRISRRDVGSFHRNDIGFRYVENRHLEK